MQITSQSASQLTGVMPVQPAVTVILPFEPHLRSKAEIIEGFQHSVDQVVEQIGERYHTDPGRLVEIRLKKIISQLNFSSFKKSVAIFVSPVFEKLIYLPFEVEPFVSVAPNFDIQEVLRAKKQNRSFLLVNLGRYSSNIYLGDGTSLSRVNLNMRDSADKQVVLPKGKGFTDRNEMREILLRSFIRRTDQVLQLLLKAYPLPVFVTGSPKVIGEFRKTSINSSRIISYIHGYFANADQLTLKQMLQPFLLQWEELKQKDIVQRVAAAANAKHLAVGIREVWKNARAQNASLLLLEENYSPAAILQPVKSDLPGSNYSLVNNTVNGIIEKVLEAGGDVELVKPGTLAGYEPIVLIERYTSLLHS